MRICYVGLYVCYTVDHLTPIERYLECAPIFWVHRVSGLSDLVFFIGVSRIEFTIIIEVCCTVIPVVFPADRQKYACQHASICICPVFRATL